MTKPDPKPKLEPYTLEAMRSALADFIKERDAILAVSQPIRDRRDALVQQGLPGREPLDAELAVAEEGLGDIQSTICMLNIALGGRSMAAA